MAENEQTETANADGKAEEPSPLVYGEPDPLDVKGLCLLSLDGGGVRGLSSILVLKSIMTRLNLERKKNGLPAVKPCEVFDLIGGTSTGGYDAWFFLAA